jgi:hypothetical protein
MVGDWSFSESSGTTTSDGSDYKNNLTLYNSPTWITDGSCINGNCLSFNSASSNYLQMAAPTGMPVGQTAKTIEAWINPTNTNPGGTVAAINDTTATYQSFILEIAVFAGTTYLFTDGKNSNNNITISGAQIPATGQWSHIVFAFDGSTGWKYYLNGVQAASGTFATTINTYNNSLNNSNLAVSIGRRSDSTNTGAYWPGKIDEVRIYSATANFAQIKEQYLAGLTDLLDKKEISQTEYDRRIADLNKSIAAK